MDFASHLSWHYYYDLLHSSILPETKPNQTKWVFIDCYLRWLLVEEGGWVGFSDQQSVSGCGSCCLLYSAYSLLHRLASNSLYLLVMVVAWKAASHLHTNFISRVISKDLRRK
ncbi:hypothetical protein NC652_021590 [Populus alba x Populus x berolinensis]|nr:hypothetical protein NC652_021590 [Populus alba x Populus x berolinensis]